MVFQPHHETWNEKSMTEKGSKINLEVCSVRPLVSELTTTTTVAESLLTGQVAVGSAHWRRSSTFWSRFERGARAWGGPWRRPLCCRVRGLRHSCRCRHASRRFVQLSFVGSCRYVELSCRRVVLSSELSLSSNLFVVWFAQMSNSCQIVRTFGRCYAGLFSLVPS